MPQKGFHIINASAGSGKTYTLVFQYLEQLLASPKKKQLSEHVGNDIYQQGG